MGENTILKIKQTVAADRKNDKQMYKAFSALGDPSRFLIFKMLLKNGGMLCVSDVASVLSISISAASQQLNALEIHKLVRKNRVGQKICYKIRFNNPVVTSLINTMNTVQ